jgi:CheY-like chemotaxis protein
MTRVLVVEDESALRSLVADVLVDAGYLVTTATDGADAMRAVRAQQPDVVLLDLVMPGMDGWAFLDSAVESPALRDVPIGIFSGASSAQAAVPNAAARIPKPFDVDDLLSTVSELAATATLRVKTAT